jgi:DNA-binding transcriptional MerR regulator
MDDEYIGPSEVADILQVTPKTVTHWEKEGKFRQANVSVSKTLGGGHRRFRKADIKRLARELQQNPNALG